jgi:hypothetical protein
MRYTGYFLNHDGNGEEENVVEMKFLFYVFVHCQICENKKITYSGKCFT